MASMNADTSPDTGVLRQLRCPLPLFRAGITQPNKLTQPQPWSLSEYHRPHFLAFCRTPQPQIIA
eukprot:scaffold132388_cov20-Prasinocladus_malaysianus.AAC.1